MNTIMHRTVVTWLHWLVAFLLLYFVIVEPHVPNFASQAAQTAALATHAGMGALLGLVVLFWTVLFAWKGQAGKAGPKLRGWKTRVYTVLNRGLYYFLPVMMLTGLAAGLLAPYLVMAFNWFPLNFGAGSATLHGFAEEVHELAFNGLLALVIAHIAFHVWRHFWLKDNALRMILPKLLHRFV